MHIFKWMHLCIHMHIHIFYTYMLHVCTSTYTCPNTPVFWRKGWTWRWGFAHKFRVVLGDVTPSKYCQCPPQTTVPLLSLPLVAELVLRKRYVWELGWFWLPHFPRRKVVSVRTEEGLDSSPSWELLEDWDNVWFTSMTPGSSKGQWKCAELNRTSQAISNSK